MNDAETYHGPRTEEDAATLRPFVPTETVLRLDDLSRAACAESEKQNARRSKLSAELKQATEAARAARQKVNALRKQLSQIPYLSAFREVDDARDKAWGLARDLRTAAIAAGQTLRRETAKELELRCHPERRAA
ncbi:MAG TPA: hypothetical protein VK178_07055 [Opitutaceae bacterium]|nr:hypothetical protein [Opitutaceae bacterium]